ncbi:MAG TPA: membrane protein insertion efficiency factor YidD [Smithellaceae bacterium]|nr:membrane protein insertion efficiency factor YidD [Smithellaceae bacterium]
MIRQILVKLFVSIIRLYQICIAPLFVQSCRFYPSCSQYAIIAINQYGPVKGSFMGVKRILRCHPWHAGGYDPVK